MKTTKVHFAEYAENQQARLIPRKEVVVYGSQNHSKTEKRQWRR
jgi:hypothetical protein